MLIYMVCFYINICCVLFPLCEAKTFEDATDLLNFLKTIPSDITPKQNQTENITVQVFMALNSINGYDPVSGMLKLAVNFILYWTDEIRIWNATHYGGLTTTKIPLQNSWIPKILIKNMMSTKTIFYFDNDVDIKVSYVRYFNNGSARMICSGLIDVTCSSNVRYFPFDSQSCPIHLMKEDFDDNYVLQHLSDQIYLEYTTPSSEWEITRTFTEQTCLNAQVEQLSFYLILTRYSLFLNLNMVAPIILLSFVNLLVFCTPVPSGERASLAFTVLLTFVVFMSVVAHVLPANEQISIFNVFLSTQLFVSAMISCCAVLSIYLYHNFGDDELDTTKMRMLIKFYAIYHMSCCRRKVGGICDQSQNRLQSEEVKHQNKEENRDDDNEELKYKSNMNLKLLMEAFDCVCFRFFLIILLLQLIIYGVVIVFTANLQ